MNLRLGGERWQKAKVTDINNMPIAAMSQKISQDLDAKESKMI
jgi:hypothetical protein